MGSTLAVISVTLLVVLSLAELGWIRLARHEAYPWADAAASIGVKVGQTLIRVATAGLLAPVYFWVWDHRLWQLPLDSVGTWGAAFLMLEFFYYWEHRLHHEVRWMWAGHRTHHSANQLNFPAAVRLSWTTLISGSWLFFLPMMWLGVHPVAVLFLLFANLTYQLWLHTEIVPKLGPLEWVLNTPSHHRVHHAVNPRCLDTNYGGVLIVFDRLFGTFAEECADDPCRYGLVTPEHSRNPFVIALRDYAAIVADLRKAKAMRDVLGYIFGPPGWAPDGRGLTTRVLRARAAG
jgi:sterol desaturase/sphingolipid hydroxylase (fatty acid hydroxylase superfamily)